VLCQYVEGLRTVNSCVLCQYVTGAEENKMLCVVSVCGQELRRIKSCVLCQYVEGLRTVNSCVFCQYVTGAEDTKCCVSM